MSSQEGSGGSRFPEEAEVLVRVDDAAVEAAAAPAAKGKRGPKRPACWEYHVEFLSRAPQPLGYQTGESEEVTGLELRLNELGAEGWELVGYGPSPLRVWSRHPDPRMIGVFKRRAGASG